MKYKNEIILNSDVEMGKSDVTAAIKSLISATVYGEYKDLEPDWIRFDEVRVVTKGVIQTQDGKYRDFETNEDMLS